MLSTCGGQLPGDRTPVLNGHGLRRDRRLDAQPGGQNTLQVLARDPCEERLVWRSRGKWGGQPCCRRHPREHQHKDSDMHSLDSGSATACVHSALLVVRMRIDTSLNARYLCFISIYQTSAQTSEQMAQSNGPRRRSRRLSPNVGSPGGVAGRRLWASANASVDGRDEDSPLALSLDLTRRRPRLWMSPNSRLTPPHASARIAWPPHTALSAGLSGGRHESGDDRPRPIHRAGGNKNL